MPAVTVLIIARNEAANIVRVLESVRGVADEVLVLDSGSTDGTQELARDVGARVLETEWRGYGPQKNWGAAQAQHDWILSLDADEALDAKLREQVVKIFEDTRSLKSSHLEVFGMRRITNFCGYWIRHGAWRKDIVWRLYHRDEAHWDDRPVHETLITDAKLSILEGELLHYSYPTLASHAEKMEPYLALSVDALYNQGKRASWSKRNLAPVWRAFRGFVLLGGWRDGWAGRQLALRDYKMVREKYRRLRNRWQQNPSV